MIELTAPYYAPMTTTLLRNPETDSRSNDVVMRHRRTMTGRHFSYVNRSSREKLELTFTNIQRAKLREVEEFVRAYSGETIKYIDHEGSIWRVVLETDPADFEISRRAAPCGESGDFELTLIGIKLISLFEQCPPILEPEIQNEFVLKNYVQAQRERFGNGANGVGFGQNIDAELEPGVNAGVGFGVAVIGELPVQNNLIFLKAPLEEKPLQMAAWQPKFDGVNIDMQAVFMGANDLEQKLMPVANGV